jgi:sarcosine oxidase subunit beta
VSFDAVIAGAGVIGASCAYHLARAGLRVLVVDRAAGPGTGSTGRATGGFRAQYGTAINIRLSLLARRHLLALRDDTGVDPGFVQVGYLWLASTHAQLEELRRANELQRREGLTEARIVDTDDIRELQPHAALGGAALGGTSVAPSVRSSSSGDACLVPGGTSVAASAGGSSSGGASGALAGEPPEIIGGAWCPSDGVMRPLEILRAYLEAAERLGATVRWGEAVTALELDGERVATVVTGAGRNPCGLAVDAGGAWAAGIAKLAGVELPVVPLRRQVVPTVATDALPASMPLTIWLDDGFHLRVRDGRALLLLPSPGAPADPWSDAVDPAWLDDVTARARSRIPALRGVEIDRARAWAGLYEMSHFFF